MVNSWSKSWRLSTPTVTGSHDMSLSDRAAGRRYHLLTPEWIRLLTTGVIGMKAFYYIQSWTLLHREASSAVPIYCFRPHKTQFISGLIDRTVIDVTQLGCPPLADISLPSISCTFACHNKSRHFCAIRTAYSLAQWLYFYIPSLQHAKCPTQLTYN